MSCGNCEWQRTSTPGGDLLEIDWVRLLSPPDPPPGDSKERPS